MIQARELDPQPEDAVAQAYPAGELDEHEMDELVPSGKRSRFTAGAVPSLQGSKLMSRDKSQLCWNIVLECAMAWILLW